MTSSDDPNAEAAVKKLLSEFSGNRYKPRAIHGTAWEYRKSGNYGRANELDQYVIDHWPGDVQVMWAKMDMAKTESYNLFLSLLHKESRHVGIRFWFMEDNVHLISLMTSFYRNERLRPFIF